MNNERNKNMIYKATITIELDDSKPIVRQIEAAQKFQDVGSDAEIIMDYIVCELLSAEAEVTANLDKDLTEVRETAEHLQSLLDGLNFKIGCRLEPIFKKEVRTPLAKGR
jgi:hypothetical protein